MPNVRAAGSMECGNRDIVANHSVDHAAPGSSVHVRPSPIPDVLIVKSEIFVDPRGSFSTIYAARELARAGLELPVAECHVARSAQAGTLRGLHFQRAPSAQAKLVRCLSGAIFDVALDLRPDAATYLQWYGCDLRQGDGLALYVPAGFAHGYLTLDADTDILYMVSAPYDPARGDGVRWDDPTFGIDWPIRPTVINERDANYPDFGPAP